VDFLAFHATLPRALRSSSVSERFIHVFQTGRFGSLRWGTDTSGSRNSLKAYQMEVESTQFLDAQDYVNGTAGLACVTAQVPKPHAELDPPIADADWQPARFTPLALDFLLHWDVSDQAPHPSFSVQAPAISASPWVTP
jgi:hypothetical protein